MIIHFVFRLSTHYSLHRIPYVPRTCYGRTEQGYGAQAKLQPRTAVRSYLASYRLLVSFYTALRLGVQSECWSCRRSVELRTGVTRPTPSAASSVAPVRTAVGRGPHGSAWAMGRHGASVAAQQRSAAPRPTERYRPYPRTPFRHRRIRRMSPTHAGKVQEHCLICPHWRSGASPRRRHVHFPQDQSCPCQNRQTTLQWRIRFRRLGARAALAAGSGA